ncbi:hypothetical protein chiPu_0015619 [Chiloscyllium punctatum]|uniref:Uncharacterized protein n=1 Tax=Chiloscyllium punctatum TaxID=137246 RepID=A0A401T3B4_CHIPU|nr:hypothetical protein [Chiloscyllium punctatum]
MADQLVHAFHSGKEHVSQDYSNRARLFTKEFKQGNFSLLLSDLRVSDKAEYICVIQMKQKTGYDVVLSVSVSLQIADISEGDREEISVSDTHHRWITPVVLVTLTFVVSLAGYILLKHFPRSSLMRVGVAAGQCELASLNVVNPTLDRRSLTQDDQGGIETEPFTKDLEDHKGETET